MMERSELRIQWKKKLKAIKTNFLPTLEAHHFSNKLQPVFLSKYPYTTIL